MLKTTGGPVLLQDYKDIDSVDWTPGLVGKYNLLIKIKEKRLNQVADITATFYVRNKEDIPKNKIKPEFIGDVNDDGEEHYLTIGQINGGDDWIYNEDARIKWGRFTPGADARHRYGVVDIKVKEREKLLELAQSYLVEVGSPKIEYLVDIEEIKISRTGKPIELGDSCDVIDDELGIEIRSRIVAIDERVEEKRILATIANVYENRNSLTAITQDVVNRQIQSYSSETDRRVSQLEKAYSVNERFGTSLPGTPYVGQIFYLYGDDGTTRIMEYNGLEWIEIISDLTGEIIKAQVVSTDQKAQDAFAKAEEAINKIQLKIVNDDTGKTVGLAMINDDGSESILMQIGDDGKVQITEEYFYIKQKLITNEMLAEGISADKITAGTLDAALANIINLNASNITSGTITGKNFFLNLDTGEQKVGDLFYVAPSGEATLSDKAKAELTGESFEWNLFDLTHAYTGDGSGADSTYAYQELYLDPTKTYEVKAFVKDGKARIDNLTLALVGGRPNPNRSSPGANHVLFVSSGLPRGGDITHTLTPVPADTLTADNNHMYISYYPASTDPALIKDTYQVMLREAKGTAITQWYPHPDEIHGKDGIGILSTTVSYGISTSPATQPTTWQTDLPTVPDGQYLWTRTITDYTDPAMADTVTYTYAKQGEKGAAGSPGTSVTVSSIEYQAGSSPTTPPTGTWSSSIVTAPEGQYLWTKTTFSDGKVAYGVAKQGSDGKAGKDAVIISAEPPTDTSVIWRKSIDDPKPKINVSGTWVSVDKDALDKLAGKADVEFIQQVQQSLAEQNAVNAGLIGDSQTILDLLLKQMLELKNQDGTGAFDRVQRDLEGLVQREELWNATAFDDLLAKFKEQYPDIFKITQRVRMDADGTTFYATDAAGQNLSTSTTIKNDGMHINVGGENSVAYFTKMGARAKNLEVQGTAYLGNHAVMKSGTDYTLFVWTGGYKE